MKKIGKYIYLLALSSVFITVFGMIQAHVLKQLFWGRGGLKIELMEMITTQPVDSGFFAESLNGGENLP